MTKRMGGLGKLSDFGKTTNAPSPATAPSETPVVVKPSNPKAKTPKPEEKRVTVNIKIPRSQHEWLNDIARQVRDNNTEPVPAGKRVYPQHLIQIAIDLLSAADVDWEHVKNVEELKKQLNL